MVLPRISRKWPLFLLLSLAILAIPFLFLSIKGAKADQNPAAIAELQRYAGNVMNTQTGATNLSQPKVNVAPNTIPVSKTWYFAEGRVGKNFREYLTIENPFHTSCAVTISYSYTLDSGSSSNKTVSATVNPLSRLTESVNSDLSIPDTSGTAAGVASVVSVNQSATPNCTGVVTERPVYFTNFNGISSGTDVLGATHLSPAFMFADIAGHPYGDSYLTVFNPNSKDAKIILGYYANGQVAGVQMMTLAANTRTSISPNSINLPNHVLAVVASDQPILAEHPFYFTNMSAGSSNVSGASDIIGATTLSNDMLFAEGYTGKTTHENLTLTNFNIKNVSSSITIILKSKTGATQSFPLTIGPLSQIIWDVNAHNNFPGSSPEVSAEVLVGKGGYVIAQREMFFNYQHTLTNGQTITATGGTDVIGQMGPATFNSYNFAEGYANKGYNAWLTIQNPTPTAESITVTLVNGRGQSYTQTVSVPANARYTEDLASLEQTAFQPGTNSTASSFSTTVQSTNGAPFIAERPIYYNTNNVSSFPTQGGTDIIGYTGN